MLRSADHAMVRSADHAMLRSADHAMVRSAMRRSGRALRPANARACAAAPRRPGPFLCPRAARGAERGARSESATRNGRRASGSGGWARRRADSRRSISAGRIPAARFPPAGSPPLDFPPRAPATARGRGRRHPAAGGGRAREKGRERDQGRPTRATCEDFGGFWAPRRQQQQQRAGGGPGGPMLAAPRPGLAATARASTVGRPAAMPWYGLSCRPATRVAHVRVEFFAVPSRMSAAAARGGHRPVTVAPAASAETCKSAKQIFNPGWIWDIMSYNMLGAWYGPPRKPPPSYRR
jgi:hypothetical protein